MGFEHAALKPLFLLNGGALVVAVGFMGAALSRWVPPTDAITAIQNAIYLWSGGLVAAALAAFAGFRSQLSFHKQRGSEFTLATINNPDLEIPAISEAEHHEGLQSADETK